MDEDIFDRVGCHVTNETFANAILVSGFKPSDGRKGKGVYFWIAQKVNCPIATELCDDWFEYKQENGRYQSNRDNEKVILWRKLVSKNSEVLYLDNIDYQFRINALIDKVARRINNLPKKQRDVLVSGMHDVFYNKYNEEHSCKIKLVVAQVPRPNAANATLADRYKMNPYACIVKDNQCIQVMEGISR
ncbi:MAG: hypothetical protein WBO26_18050 [Providencia rettgeri]